MKHKIVSITPTIAKEYLEKGDKRNVNEERVAFFADQMKKGNWRSIGDTIKFSTEGNLIDGKHTLHAIVKSGITTKIIVVSNIETEILYI